MRLHVAYSHPLPDDRLGRDHDSVGRLDGALLASIAPPLDADFYVCGPLAFMSEIQTALEERGVARERVHSESFGPVG